MVFVNIKRDRRQAMSIFVGGCIALILGIFGIIFWWWHFVVILQGVIPIMLIFAGALAVYLSIDQFKAYLNRNKKQESVPVGSASTSAAADDVDALRKENEELKKKLAENKVDEAGEKVKDMAKDVGDTVKDAAAEVKDAVTDAAEDAKDAVEEAVEEVKDNGKGKK